MDTFSKKILITNNVEWRLACWENVVQNDSGFSICVEENVLKSFGIFRGLFKLHYNPRLNSSIKIPFKSIWYNKMVDEIGIEDNTNLIIYDWTILSIDLNFIKYIKRRFKNIKVFYLFSNIVQISGAKTYKLLNKLNIYYDKVFAFDKQDAIKYNFDFSRLIYEVKDIENSLSIKQDVFYVGQAKDRLDKLIFYYKMFKELGLCSNINIVGVSNEQKRYDGDIIYNKPMSYKDVLTNIKMSRCLLDVIQGNSTGMTIKVCEAVYFDKKLITTNAFIEQEPYFDSSRILVVNDNTSICDIKDFFAVPMKHYSSEEKKLFSAQQLFDRM